MIQLSQSVLDTARSFVCGPAPYTFTENEARVLRPFFTNLDRRVFFLYGMPPNVGAMLLAMFSRMKNPRGIRGVFVDSFLPQFLATQIPEAPQDFVTFDEFLVRSSGASGLCDEFLRAVGSDPEYVARLADMDRTRKFLSLFLDKYGHNSIARTAMLWICYEGVSLLAAKSIERSRPGAGYIELSTRYVQMKTRSYPIGKEFETGWGVSESLVDEWTNSLFADYHHLMGEDLSGPFPNSLRSRYGGRFEGDEKDLERGVMGEACDVLANLLPTSTLTSVAVAITGEAFPGMLKHLLLDNTPENNALVEMTMKEAGRIGGHQFARHFEPTEWDKEHTRYLDDNRFAVPLTSSSHPLVWAVGSSAGLEESLAAVLAYRCPLYAEIKPFGSLLDVAGYAATRSSHDKLPKEFESAGLTVGGVMSFRGWRDVMRQGFCTHARTLLTPALGFYEYDKGGDNEAFAEICVRVEREFSCNWLSLHSRGIPEHLLQFILPIGFRVGFLIGANLRQWEFCNWQRTKPDVNHEVRQVFMGVERILRDLFQWWARLSRADLTRSYVFARSKPKVLVP